MGYAAYGPKLKHSSTAVRNNEKVKSTSKEDTACFHSMPDIFS
jgi:hypothetical protein